MTKITMTGKKERGIGGFFGFWKTFAYFCGDEGNPKGGVSRLAKVTQKEPF